MMKFKTLLTFLSMLAIVSACSNGKPTKQQVSNQTSEALTYQKMWETVFGKTDGEGIEWHGEALDETAKIDLSIEKGSACGGQDCGETIRVKNNSDQPIELVVQSTFSIPDFPPYTALKIIAAPKSVNTIGCSHLCINNQSIVFSPKIVGAKYLE